MADTEITTAAERGDAATEGPRLTLGELQALLREATAYQRAQHPAPVVLHGPETTPAYTAGAHPVRGASPAGPGHPGIDITIPSGCGFPLPVNLAPLPPVAETRTYAPLAFATSCVLAASSAFGTAVTGGNPLLITATLASIAAAGVALAKIWEAGR